MTRPKLDPARGKIYDSLFWGTVEHNQTKCPFVHETAFFGFAITGQIVKFTKSFQGNPKLDSQDEVTNRYAIDQQAQNWAASILHQWGMETNSIPLDYWISGQRKIEPSPELGMMWTGEMFPASIWPEWLPRSRLPIRYPRMSDPDSDNRIYLIREPKGRYAGCRILKKGAGANGYIQWFIHFRDYALRCYNSCFTHQKQKKIAPSAW